MSGSTTFDEPTSLAEAEALRVELTNDVQSIQAQLGDKQRTDEDGNRLTSKEYWSWKKRAQHALNQKLDHLRYVKTWIRENRQAAYPSRMATADEAIAHVRTLCSILLVMRDEEVEFSAEESLQIDAAKNFLVRVGIQTNT